MSIQLSYVLTTFNKMQYLRLTLPVLLSNLKDDEEIIVVDGGSVDGTADFLRDIFGNKANCRFVTEKDSGEAHGTNKGLLLAQGIVIKLVTDDDLFNFDAIAICKKFMLENEFDVIGGNGMGCVLPGMQLIQHDYTSEFRKRGKVPTPVFFSGLSLMLRKTSIPLLGLFHTGIKMIDLEYVLRITSLNIKLGFYPGNLYCNIVNVDSNSSKHMDIFYKEQVKIDLFYKGKKTNNSQRIRYKLNKFLGRKIKASSPAGDLESTYRLVRDQFNAVSAKAHSIIDG